MARWEPDARQRLERAALDLFVERGFDQATVPDITARAGLTTRTFFRYFADKREVLFGDEERLPELAAHLVDAAAPGLGPMAVVQQGLTILATNAFDGRRDEIRQRKVIIEGNDGLRERELRKMALLTDAVAAAFRARGVDDLSAAVVAQTAVGIVQVSLRRWIESDGETLLADLMDETFTTLNRAFGRAGLEGC
jgi:AcrR family transcriptional regulator